jgi:cytochrome P450
MTRSVHAVDLSDDQTFAHGFPFEYFAHLRRESPVFWHEPTDKTPDGEGFWVVSSYQGVKDVFRDAVTFSSDKGGIRERGGTAIKDEASAGRMLNQTDDPQHQRLRSLVSRGFTPQAVSALKGGLRSRAEALIERLEPQSSDLVEVFARELPSQAICMILGVPEQDRAPLLDLMDAGISADSGSIIDVDVMRSIRAYAKEFIAAKRASPDDSMTSVIIQAREADGSTLSDKELYSFFELLFLAGSETTRSAIAGAVLEFAHHPEQWERLRADSGLIPTAVEEIVRWTTPSVYKRRTASCNTQVLGVPIGRGDKVTVWEMSANRDGAVFVDPDTFDIGRSPNPHLGFGFGVHFCLGASLARLELTITLEVLRERCAEFWLTGEPEWMPNNRLLGLRRLDVGHRPLAR